MQKMPFSPSSSDADQWHNERHEDDSDDPEIEIVLREREWARLKSRYEASGYKEGISDAREASLQEGFNDGFNIGTTSGFAIGHLKGIVSALRIIVRKQSDSIPPTMNLPSMHFPLQIELQPNANIPASVKTHFSSAEELLSELDTLHVQLSSLVFHSKEEISAWQHVLDPETHQLVLDDGSNFSSLGATGSLCVLRILAIGRALKLFPQSELKDPPTTTKK